MSYTGLTPLMTQYCDYISKYTDSEARDGVLILEIGVDRGQTTYPLIQSLTQKDIKFTWVGVDIRLDKTFVQAIHVMSGVDHHFVTNGNPNAKSTVRYNINDSRKFLKDDMNVYDLVLIDADHNYDTVSEELSHLNRITHPGSLVIMDDYGGKLLNRDTWFHLKDSHKDLKHAAHDLDTSENKGGVTRAVDEFIENNEGLWAKHVLPGAEDCCVLLRALQVDIDVPDPRPAIYVQAGNIVKPQPGKTFDNVESVSPASFPITDISYICKFDVLSQ